MGKGYRKQNVLYFVLVRLFEISFVTINVSIFE
jgi:hypothetical protein